MDATWTPSFGGFLGTFNWEETLWVDPELAGPP